MPTTHAAPKMAGAASAQLPSTTRAALRAPRASPAEADDADGQGPRAQHGRLPLPDRREEGRQPGLLLLEPLELAGRGLAGGGGAMRRLAARRGLAGGGGGRRDAAAGHGGGGGGRGRGRCEEEEGGGGGEQEGAEEEEERGAGDGGGDGDGGRGRRAAHVKRAERRRLQCRRACCVLLCFG